MVVDEPTMREPALNLERDLGIPLPITKDSQAAMAQPPPARVRDRSADLGTTYVMQELTLEWMPILLRFSQMRHPFLFLLIFQLQQRMILFCLLHGFLLLSSLLHSLSTFDSIHPMVTRSRDGTRRPRAFFYSPYTALLAPSSPT